MLGDVESQAGGEGELEADVFEVFLEVLRTDFSSSEAWGARRRSGTSGL